MGDRVRWAMGATLLAGLVLLAAPASAATGSAYAEGLGSPAAVIAMGGQVWVADRSLGLCRIDPDTTSARVNPDTCSRAAEVPGQPAFDPVNNQVYVPDAGGGVWRLAFDPGKQSVDGPVLLADPAKEGASAAAVGPDGAVYLAYADGGTILRVTNPRLSYQSLEAVGRTSDGGGVVAMAFAGADLYLAEQGGVSRVAGAAGCSGDCVAQRMSAIDASAPTAIAAYGDDVLYVADTPVAASTILRYTISTDTLDVYAVGSDSGAFQFARGLALDSLGNLYVSDDATGGTQPRHGRLWKLAAGSAPQVAGTSGSGAAAALAGGFAAGSLYARGLSGPAGVVAMGTRLWAADRAAGFCRIDVDPAGGVDLNAGTCSRSAAVPGQPSFDPAHRLVYVPDGSRPGGGIWRLTFNAATETVGRPARVAADADRLAARRAGATALGPDGNLYVGFLDSGEILRVNRPQGVDATVEAVGRTAGGAGALSLAFAGADLYVVEGLGVTRIVDAGSCDGGCTAERVPSLQASRPTAIASDHANVLYVASTPAVYSEILRYSINSGSQVVYASGSDRGALFENALGLGLDEHGNLYVADDPANGAQLQQGRVWRVAPAR